MFYQKYLFGLLLLFVALQTTYSNELMLNGRWGFVQTKHIPSLKDIKTISQWESVNVPGALLTNPQHGIYGTYRYQFDLPEAQRPSEESLGLFIQGIRHGDNAYLNGHLIGQTGALIKNWDIFTANPHNLPRLYPLDKHHLKPTNNILIIQINLGIGEAYSAMRPGGVGITESVSILPMHTATKTKYQLLSKITVTDSIIITLGVIDLLLILLLFRRTLHNLPEYKWLLLSSLMLMFGSLLLDTTYLNNITHPLLYAVMFLFILFLPLVTAMFFYVQHLNVPSYLFGLAFIVIAICSAILITTSINPDYKSTAWMLWGGVMALLFAYSFYCAIIAVIHRHVGSVSVLIGMIVYLALIRTQWYELDIFDNRTIVFGSLVFRYALIFSYFQKIQAMSYSYRELSNQMLHAMEENKKTIARDIHDGLGQHLAGAKIQQQLASQTHDTQHESLSKQELQNAMDSMRRIIDGLHPALLEEHTFKEAVQIEVSRFKELHQIEIKADIPEWNPDAALSVHLFRVLQELLNNAVRHGQATYITITLNKRKHRLKLIVRDNGIGFDANTPISKTPTKGFGSISLRERIDLLDGTTQYSKNEPQGTSVTITLPLPRN